MQVDGNFRQKIFCRFSANTYRIRNQEIPSRQTENKNRNKNSCKNQARQCKADTVKRYGYRHRFLLWGLLYTYSLQYRHTGASVQRLLLNIRKIKYSFYLKKSMHSMTYKLDSSLLNWPFFESAALVTFHIHCFDIVDANPIETCAAYEIFWMCRHVAPNFSELVHLRGS
jgi:hypothetical protein